MEYMFLKGKRILLFPGNFAMCQIVKRAKKLGLYTIVTDFYDDWDKSPAKKIADEAYDINYADLDLMVDFCAEHRIDGVFSSFTENGCLAAAKLCERMGLPFYATSEQIKTTRDKAKFKKLCAMNGLKTVEEYHIDPDTKDIPADIRYPVVVKPVDNGGSKGITIAYDDASLRKSIDYALLNSKSKNIIVERYMTGQECNVTYTMQNGNAVLSLVSDSQLSNTEKGHLNLPYAWLFPSRHYKRVLEEDDANIKKMFASIGMKEGSCYLTCFAEPDGMHYFEAGYRLAGGMPFLLQEYYYNDKNYADLMIAYSITGDSSMLYDLSYDRFDTMKPCGDIVILLRGGTISRYIGFDRLMEIPGVIDISELKPLGHTVLEQGDYGQNLCRINIVSNSGEGFAQTVDMIYDTIDVLDENGESMLFGRFDSDIPRNYWG